MTFVPCLRPTWNSSLKESPSCRRSGPASTLRNRPSRTPRSGRHWPRKFAQLAQGRLPENPPPGPGQRDRVATRLMNTARLRICLRNDGARKTSALTGTIPPATHPGFHKLGRTPLGNQRFAEGRMARAPQGHGWKSACATADGTRRSEWSQLAQSTHSRIPANLSAASRTPSRSNRAK